MKKVNKAASTVSPRNGKTQKFANLTQLLFAVTVGVRVFWLALSQEREIKKDVFKATNTWSTDYRYRTINVLVKLPIGVSVLGRVCSLCMSSDGEPRLWPGKSHNNGAWCFVSTFQRHSFFFLPVIRPRKWLVTCSWEPMEKNTHRINGAAAGRGAERVGGDAAGPRRGLWWWDSIEAAAPEPCAPSLGTGPLYPARIGGRPDNVALYLVWQQRAREKIW